MLTFCNISLVIWTGAITSARLRVKYRRFKNVIQDAPQKCLLNLSAQSTLNLEELPFLTKTTNLMLKINTQNTVNRAYICSYRQYLCSENTVQGLVRFSLFGDNLEGLDSSGSVYHTLGVMQTKPYTGNWCTGLSIPSSGWLGA